MQAPPAPSPLQNPLDTIGKQFENVQLPTVGNIGQNVNAGIDNVNASIGTLRNNVTDAIGQFSSQTTVNASQDFLSSNSVIAKFAFLILVVIVFVFLVNLGINAISYFTQKTKNVCVVNGLASGNANLTITQNPRIANSVTINRSNNQASGMEFTWSIWLYIEDIKTSAGAGTFSHIFNKGDSQFDASGVSKVTNAPGLYVSNTTNTLRLYIDAVNPTAANQTFMDITNIPLKKWAHVAIKLINNKIDVYVNGVISGRKILDQVAKQNYDDVRVGANGGFVGQLSNLCYYDYAMGVFEINNIVLQGPNLKQSSAIKSNVGYYGYLSNQWYSSKL